MADLSYYETLQLGFYCLLLVGIKICICAATATMSEITNVLLKDDCFKQNWLQNSLVVRFTRQLMVLGCWRTAHRSLVRCLCKSQAFKTPLKKQENLSGTLNTARPSDCFTRQPSNEKQTVYWSCEGGKSRVRQYNKPKMLVATTESATFLCQPLKSLLY